MCPFIFATSDTNVAEKGGNHLDEVFEEEGRADVCEGEVQEQISSQSNPSLDAYLVLLSYSCITYTFYKLHVLLFIYASGYATRNFSIPPLRVLLLVDT
jgi:hypothetical protein